VSRFRWKNTYHFGDFHGSVETLLKYYDAHFYTANWGTVSLGLAFPKSAINRSAIRPYLRGGEQQEDTLTFKTTGDRCIIWWERYEEEVWNEVEGEGFIDRLIGIREELLRGDYRALFLGWLADFDPEEWQDPGDKAVLLPPIPNGLDQLSDSLEALIDQFPVDRDALDVAAKLVQGAPPDRIPIASALEKLSVSQMRALLARVAEGGGPGVMTELNRLTYPKVQTPASQEITCIDFAAKTLEARNLRMRKKAQAAEEKRRPKRSCSRR
jgi:hypothetical protein